MFEQVLQQRLRGRARGPLDWTPATASGLVVDCTTWFDSAEGLLDQMQQSQLVLQRSEAERIGLLVRGYEAAIAEAAADGVVLVGRSGPIAHAFLLQAALVLGVAERTSAHLLDTAVAVRDELPLTWALFHRGGAQWRAIDLVERQRLGLDADRLAAYDEAAATAVELTPTPRLKDRLHRLRERLQADTAVERRRVAEQLRHVEIEPREDGQAALTLIGPAEQIIAVHDVLCRAAVAAHGASDEQRCIGALQHDIAVDLLLDGAQVAADDANARVPQRTALAPQVFVTVPALSLLGRSDEPAHLDGYGPIDIGTARRLTAQAPSLTRILTDPLTGVRLAMDRRTYAVPSDLKRYLRVRDGTCRAPGCGRPAARCDLDHTVAWADGGRTDADNLASLCRRHHQLKGDGIWSVELEPGGRMVWVSPWSRRYVTEPADGPQPAPRELLIEPDGDPPF